MVFSSWLAARIAPYREAAKVSHPRVYVSEQSLASANSTENERALYLFNCAQRAHHNVMENYPATLSAMLLGGIQYPRLAAALGWLWLVGRFVYAVNYSSTSAENILGKGRFFYGGFHLAATVQVGLYGLVAFSGIKLLRD